MEFHEFFLLQLLLDLAFALALWSVPSWIPRIFFFFFNVCFVCLCLNLVLRGSLKLCHVSKLTGFLRQRPTFSLRMRIIGCGSASMSM